MAVQLIQLGESLYPMEWSKLSKFTKFLEELLLFENEDYFKSHNFHTIVGSRAAEPSQK